MLWPVIVILSVLEDFDRHCFQIVQAGRALINSLRLFARYLEIAQLSLIARIFR